MDAPGDDVRQWLDRFAPDAPVVAVPVFNAYEDVMQCIASLLETSGAGVPILVIDDGSTDGRIAAALAPLAAQGRLHYVRKPANAGFVAAANDAFAWAAPHDVVLLNSDVVVPEGWLERLRAVATAREGIATATPLTNHGSILSVPHRNTPVGHLPRGLSLAELDGRIRRVSRRLAPVIPTAVAHCTYFRRAALTTVGYFDPAFAPGYGEEVDFSQRAVAAGFCHVAADDLFVYHKGSRSFGPERSGGREVGPLPNIRRTHEREIAARYPWYHTWVRVAGRDERSPLALALETARIAVLGARIALDATALGEYATGTQAVVSGLARALCRAKGRDTHLTLIVRDGLDARQLAGLDAEADAIVAASALRDRGQARFDLVHRPVQCHTIEDLRRLRSVARRVVVTHLDFIAFANPAYFAEADAWLRYRLLTKTVLGSVDGVAFISETVMAEAARQGVAVPDARACVTGIGVDAPPPAAERRVPEAEGAPFVLVLGTDFKHKNRAYALHLLDRLVGRYGWAGNLLLVGPQMASGGSGAEEAVTRVHRPDLARRVRSVEQVGEPEKWWLLRNAALVLYPSIAEGFGLVPFEAAAADTPALASRFGALREALGGDPPALHLADVDADAAAAWEMLSDPAAAARQIAAVRARRAAFSWETVAERTLAFYEHVLRLPPQTPAEPLTEATELAHRSERALERQRRAMRAVEEGTAEMQAEYQRLRAQHEELGRWAQSLEERLREPESLGARVVRRATALRRR